MFTLFFWQWYPLKRFNLFFGQWYLLKHFNNLEFCKWDPNDRTVKVDTYLKSLYFSASNGEYCKYLRLFSIFEYIPRIFCIWNPNDRIVKVDTYLKSPMFSASNGEWYNSLRSFWIFGFIPRIFCRWNPNDCSVKVDTYLKSLKFSASNDNLKYYPLSAHSEFSSVHSGFGLLDEP